MKKKLHLAFIMAILTAAGIIGFQSYWLYQHYLLTEENFLASAANALQKSANTYILRRTDYALRHTSALCLLENAPEFIVSKQATTGNDRDTEIQNQLDSLAQKETATLSKNYNLAVQSLIDEAVRQTFSNKTDLPAIDTLYKKELAKSGIYVLFTLSIGNDSATSNNEVTAILHTSPYQKKVLRAALMYDRYYLLTQMRIPILTSLLLVLLTFGCIGYWRRIVKRQQQLNAMQKDFINNMTHELRTPISILRSTHESLHQFGNVHDPDVTLRYLKINQSVIEKMENSVERILNITQYEEQKESLLKPEDVALQSFIETIIGRFTANSQRAIHLQFHRKEPIVRTDKYSIDTIVSNLIDNALKYGVAGDIIVTVDDQSHGWTLQVHDDGPGIRQEYLPYLFDKFYRIPSGNLHDIKGYGLGLSYVKELTILLHGEVSVETAASKGTTFTIYFPQSWSQ